MSQPAIDCHLLHDFVDNVCVFFSFCLFVLHNYSLGKSVGLVIERLLVRIPAGAAGEFSSPELTLYADSY